MEYTQTTAWIDPWGPNTTPWVSCPACGAVYQGWHACYTPPLPITENFELYNYKESPYWEEYKKLYRKLLLDEAEKRIADRIGNPDITTKELIGEEIGYVMDDLRENGVYGF